MTWELHVPYRDLDAPLDVDAVMNLPKALAGEDEQVARALLQVGQLCRFKSIREVVWALEAMDAEQRRFTIDKVRRFAGLKSATAIDRERSFAFVNQAGASRAARSSGWQFCHAADCDRIPLSDVGIPCETPVRKWFCTEHADQAQAGDLEPRGSGIRLSPSGALVPDDGDLEAAELAREESVRRQREEQDAARAVEGAEYDRYRRAREQELRSLLPPLVPG